MIKKVFSSGAAYAHAEQPHVFTDKIILQSTIDGKTTVARAVPATPPPTTINEPIAVVAVRLGGLWNRIYLSELPDAMPPMTSALVGIQDLHWYVQGPPTEVC